MFLQQFFGTIIGIGLAWLLVMLQNFYSFVSVPGTSIPYPVSLTSTNVIIVFLTVVLMGIITSAWSSSAQGKV